MLAANFAVARTGLLAPQIKIKREEHEENQQRVFFANAIKGNGIEADTPERGGHQPRPAIEECSRQQKQRDDGQGAENSVWKAERELITECRRRGR